MRPVLRITLLLTAVMVTIIGTTNAQSAWEVVHEPYVESTLQDVSFINGTHGWAVGFAGTALRTVDTGSTWEDVSPEGVDVNLVRVQFLSAEVGWIGAADGSVLRTTDGGTTWRQEHLADLLPHVDVNQFRDMSFVDAETGWAVIGRARQSYVLKTSDGGENWAVQDSLSTGANENWLTIDFYDANRGAIAGDLQGTHWYTADGGETWNKSELEDPFYRRQNQIVWLDEDTVVSVGEGLEFQMLETPIYRSIDGGATWAKSTQEGENPYDRVRDVYFMDEHNGIGVGSNGFSRQFVTRTDDGGQSWTTSTAPFSFGLQRISGSNDTLVVLGAVSHFIRSFDFGETWEIVPLKMPSAAAGLAFVEDVGYLITRNGLVYRNDDGTGASWTYTGETGLWDAQALEFVDPRTGFALKDNRHVVRTTDGGVTWETVLEPVVFNSQNRGAGLAAPSRDVIYVWGSENTYREYSVYKSADGGDTWTEVEQVSADAIIGGTMAFFDENVGVLLGPDLWIHRTNDGGNTWETDVTVEGFPAGFEGKDFRDVAVIDENVAWAVGQQFIARTEDRGATWQWIDHGVADIDSNFYAITFLDDGDAFIGSFDGTIISSEDGGVTWEVDTSVQGKYILFEAAFSDKGQIVFGTSNGHLIRRDVSGVSVEDGTRVQDTFVLEANYPNPFNSRTTIGFTIENSGGVELTVYDLTGRMVARLVNGTLNPGHHEVEFDAQGLSSGLYLYQLETQSRLERRKMILVK